jgi:hypothetical protein
MKKHLLALLLLAGTSAQAQTIHLGLKFGVGFSRFVGANVPDNSLIGTFRKFGINAGGLAEIGFSDHWSVQPELLYTVKGTKQIFSAPGSDQVLQQQLRYLDVPLLVKFKTHHVFVEAGPQIGLLLSAVETYERGATSTDTDNKDLFRTADPGYVLGLGVQDTNGLLLGVRYNGGFPNVYAQGVRARNSDFQVYLGYVFGGNPK